ncbi:MAG: glycosyltransferase family 2 protein [Chloroflexi bacterium]|nr:glycosyltransferase family 2 protein [Chloroflexota bacterium]
MAISPMALNLDGGLDLANERSVDISPAGGSRVSVVIPTLNEERNIGWVLEHLPPLLHEVILVDGRSRDRTVEVAVAIRPDIVLVREQTPGKGAALRAGFAATTGDVLVMLDADCSMDPAEIPSFVAAIEAGADVAKGSRFLAGGGTVDISALRQLGNGALLRMTNLLYGAGFSELCYGYMAFRRSSLMALGLRSTGFEIETEIVVRALRAGLRIREVPSFEAERRFGVSNLRTFRDGWRVARTVLSERFTREATPDITMVAAGSALKTDSLSGS